MRTQAVRFYDGAAAPADFRDAVVRGLGAHVKSIAPKFFYDRRGSELFDKICELPEYYIPRVETAMLRDAAQEIAALTGPDCALVEFGSGASRKVRLLLEAVRPDVYFGVDISREFLRQSTYALARDYPWLAVRAVCADLCRPLSVPTLHASRRRLVFYPGSSIGNFEPEEARAFLRNVHPLLGADGGLLIGVDLKKDPSLLHAAYNDSAGVTAAFNLNLLTRMQRELRADVDVAGFAHRAFYDETRGRIEMHLVSRRPQRIQIRGERFSFAAGETIHTENSYKYTVDEFYALSRAASLSVERTWVDPQQLFSVHYLRAAA
jgi:dimethylhistidine N-methyltransferase